MPSWTRSLVETRVSFYDYLFWMINSRMIRTAPTFADWTSLTELQAFILEALRWRPVNPFGQYLSPRSLVHTNLSTHTVITGAPRRVTKDVFWVYLLLEMMRLLLKVRFQNGYCIPAGATVFGNHW